MSSQLHYARRIALTLSLAGLAAGCAVSGPEEARAPSSLLEVEIPEDFTFATARPLAVRAEGDAALIADTLADVRLPSGDLVHRGPLALAVELSIPTAVEHLAVTLRSPAGERTLEVPVNGAEAVVVVE